MLEEIQEKCDKVNLKTKLTNRKIPDREVEGETIERTELFIEIPFEREFKNIIITQELEEDDLEKVNNSTFEKCRFLKGVEGIYNLDEGFVECEIQTDDIYRNPSFLMRRLFRFIPSENIQTKEIETEDEERRIISRKFEFPAPSDEIKVFIGDSSTEFSILSGFKRDSFFYRRSLSNFQTIRIEGLQFKTHDEAKELLQKIGNSVFFQIDLATDFPLHLSLDRDIKREMRIRRRAAREDLKFTEPKFQYDKEAINLYW